MKLILASLFAILFCLGCSVPRPVAYSPAIAETIEYDHRSLTLVYSSHEERAEMLAVIKTSEGK